MKFKVWFQICSCLGYQGLRTMKNAPEFTFECWRLWCPRAYSLTGKDLCTGHILPAVAECQMWLAPLSGHSRHQSQYRFALAFRAARSGTFGWERRESICTRCRFGCCYWRTLGKGKWKGGHIRGDAYYLGNVFEFCEVPNYTFYVFFYLSVCDIFIN